MTCRTLLALISAAMVWNLPNITLAQAMQDGSEQSLDPATNASEATGETEAVLQMPAKKTPPKGKTPPKKSAAPPKAGRGKASPKGAAKPAPKLIPKPGKPAGKPAPPRQAPFFPPSPPIQLDSLDDSRFQVPMPEEKGDLNIWGDDPAVAVDYSIASNQLGLVAIGNYLGTGFGLEYQRRSFSWMDWGLQLSSTKAELSKSRNSETDEFLTTRMTAARLSLRFFNQRWLYLGAGLSMNNVEGRYGWKGPGVADEEIAAEFKAQIVALDIVLGSQWEFGRYFVGMDWVGLGAPVSGSIETKEDIDLDDLTNLLTGSTTDERIGKELAAQFRPYYGLLKLGLVF